MVKRPLLGILLVTLATASMLAVSGDATAATTETFVLRPNEYLETGAGLPDNWGRDTVLTQSAPDGNYKNEQFMNTSGFPDRENEIALRFPLDQPMRVNLSDPNKDPTGPLPPNLSVTTTGGSSATLTLFYKDSMRDQEKGRDLGVFRLNKPWEEGELTWEEAREKTNFIGTSPIEVSPGTSALQEPGLRQWDVTPYLADVLNPQNPASFFGFLVRDVGGSSDCTESPTDCEQEFYSSNWLTDSGLPDDCQARSQAQGGCIPELEVTARINEPQVQNITFTGGHNGEYVAPDVPLNVSADVWDPAGEIEETYLDVHHENGTRMFREDIDANRSRNLTGDRPQLPTSFKTWWNASLDLEPGRYTFNFSIRDSDDRWQRTGFTEPNVTVEATQPIMANVTLDASDSRVGDETEDPLRIEGQGTVDFTLDARDTRGIDQVWAVLDHTDRPPVRTDTFGPGLDVDETGNGSYSGEHTFAFPGTYNVSLKARDRPGNVLTERPCDVNATQPCAIKVVDEEKPTILESCIVGESLCRTTLQGQEIGGELTFRVRATDNHPKAPDVSLEVTLPNGAERTYDSGKVGDHTWERALAFGSEAEWPPGEYEARWVVEDPDGNVRRSPDALSFIVEAAGPPTVTEVAPTGWGGAQPEISATVEDVNVDPDRIHVAVSVNDAPFDPIQTSVRATETRAFVSATLGPFVHGDEIRVRINATDTLGRYPDQLPFWSFNVDDRNPQADLDFQGEALEGLTRRVIPSSTELVFTGSDGNESGLDRVEFRIAPRGGSFSDWQAAGGAVNVTNRSGYQGSGPYTIEYRAVDEAGNTGGANSVELYVDTEAPTIDYRRFPDRLEVTVEDPGAGVEDVRVFYRNRSNPFQSLPVSLLQKTSDGAVYEAEIPFTPRGTPVQVYFAATDELGHTRTLGPPDTAGVRPINWQQPNHPPDVTIASPTPGANVSGTLPVVWDASDPDGDSFRVQVSARPAPLDTFRKVADPAGNPGRAQWDTAAFEDGRYVLRVTAKDGRNTTHATTVVDVRNTELGLAGLGIPDDVEPGESTPLSVTIYRDVSTVEATVTITRDGVSRTAATVPLRDDGRAPDEAADDSTFTGTFTPQEEGDYSVSLDVTYGDGSAESMDAVGAFAVQTTLAERLEANQDVVAAAGAILVVLAAATVIQLYRYGYI